MNVKKYPGFSGEGPKATPPEEERRLAMERARQAEQELYDRIKHVQGNAPEPPEFAEKWKRAPLQELSRDDVHEDQQKKAA